MGRPADAAVVHEFRRPWDTHEVAIPTLDSREALIEFGSERRVSHRPSRR